MASLPANLTEIRALIDQDRKKAGLLAVLTLAFIVIMIRTFGGGNFAAETAAAIMPATQTNHQRSAVASEPKIGNLGSPAVRAWIDGPLPPLTRNIFVVDLTRFRPVPNANPAEIIAEHAPLEAVDRAGNADQMRVDRARLAAQALRLQQVWVSTNPNNCSAVINGRLLRPGQMIDSFRLITVERNTVVIEREGVEVTLKMPGR